MMNIEYCITNINGCMTILIPFIIIYNGCIRNIKGLIINMNSWI